MKKWGWVAVLAVLVFVVGYSVAARAWGLPGLLPPGDTGNYEEKAGIESVYSLGQFITNLKDSGRYVRINLDLQAVDDYSLQQLVKRNSEIKTDIYALLRSKTLEELSGEMGLRNLQTEIFDWFNSKYPGMVAEVFFTEFIVQ